jgi:predicted amidohydrolase YtcJ
MPLDTLVTGRIATLAGATGFGWVEAIGIRDGRIAFAGSEVDLETRADPFTRRIRLEPDQVAVPGLTDAHLHLAQAAMAARHVDLSDARSIDEGLARIRTAHEALPPDAWLEGHGWDSDRWGRWPTAEDLEGVAPGRRAALWAHDHHALWASHAALALGGFGVDDPPGGVVRRDDTGRPEGVLYETATRLVTIHVPPPTDDDLQAAIETIGHELVRLGVVACHDPGGVAPDPDLTYAFPATPGLLRRAACRSASMPACATTRSPRPSPRATGAAWSSVTTLGVEPSSVGRSASRTAHSARGPRPCSRTSSRSRTAPSRRSCVAASG